MSSLMWSKTSVFALLLCLTAGSAAAGNIELASRAFLDPDKSDDSGAGVWIGAGYRALPEALIGIYGSRQGADRTAPAKMDEIWGAGVFAEVGPDLPEFLFVPYMGIGIGLIDPSGIEDKTLAHLTGAVGVRLPLSDRFAFTAGATLHWVNRDFFDPRADDANRQDGERTDVTGDIGIAIRL